MRKYDAVSLGNQFPTFRPKVVPAEGYTAVNNRADLCLRHVADLKLSQLILCRQNDRQVLSDLVKFICVIRFSEKYLNQRFVPLFVPRTPFECVAKPTDPSQQNVFKYVKYR